MPTTNMALTLPTEDGSDGLWDSLLNDALELIDAHDHSTGKGVTVKTAGLQINADLTFGGYAATALKAAAFSAVATTAVSALSKALFVNTADSELYWRTSGGVNVKLTSGTSLNTALIGGFTGDYGGGDEEAEFTSSSGIFDFRVAATERAYVDCSDIRLFEKSTGITNAVKLKSPASLAASYTVTFPAAVPASTSVVQMSSTGVLTASPSGNIATSGTVATGALTVTGAATVSTTLGVTGAATLSSTLGVTGLITATAGLTAAANQHVTVSGTGQFKHGSRTIVISGAAFTTPNPPTDAIIVDTADTGYIALDAATDRTLIAAIPLPAGKRITQMKWTLAHGADASTRTYTIRHTTLSSQVSATDASNTDTTSGGAAFQITTGSLTITLAAGLAYFVSAALTHTADKIYGVELTYDEP